MECKVRQFKDGDKDAWDAYVRGHPDGTFFHLSGWKRVIETGCRQSTLYLIAEDKTGIKGVLPATHRKSLLFGNALISNMFCVYGGALSDSQSVQQMLDEEMQNYMRNERLDFYESRSIDASHKDLDGWQESGAKSSTFLREIADDPEQILLQIPRKQRAVVRKALKNGLKSVIGHDQLDRFYHQYALSVRNLGTPVFPKAMFKALIDVFRDDVEISIIEHSEGQAIAGLMSFFYEDTVLPYYAGGDVTARKYGAHDFMYYDLMCRARKKGYTVFDFGRSKNDSGPYKFKKNWGFEPKELGYETYCLDTDKISNLSPDNPKYKLMINVWKKLPLPIANCIGPLLARHLG